MAATDADDFHQLCLFDLPPPPARGWHPAELAAGLHVRWMPPAEMDGRLDAGYYLIARRPEQLLQRLTCPLVTLDGWAAVNPAQRRLPVERGYILHEHCLYAETRDIDTRCWVMGPQLRTTTVDALPVRAAMRAEPGDLLLPRVYSSLHRAVMVVETALPLMVSDAFALLQPRSPQHGLALLALLHHRILGEQLWALASGTTVRMVAVEQVSSLRVPAPPDSAIAALADQVKALLAAQIDVSFPLYRVAPVHYWQEIAPHRQKFNVDVLLAALWEMLDDALRAC